jgi:hypothetical protein
MKKLLAAALALLLVFSAASCGKTPNMGAKASGSDDAAQGTSAAAVTAAGDWAPVPICLRGTIGGLPVHMTLQIKDGKITGSYYYDRIKEDLKLDGTIEENRYVKMKENDGSGAATGTFDGLYVPGISFTGSWTNAKTDETLDFSLTVIGGIPKDAVWAGEWRRADTGRFNSATLVIFNETKTDFEFQLDAFSGANMGFLDGKAPISGTSASYEDASTGAKLTFSLKDGLITLEANDAANGQAGAGVAFGGKFTKGELPEDTLLSLGYVPDKASDDAFRAMVGKDYELFLNTAMIRGEAEDLDGFGAEVYTWWVRGVAMTNASVVMFLPDGKLCAAVIDPDAGVAKVYTNSGSVTSVPKTVRNWLDGFPGVPAEFQVVK